MAKHLPCTNNWNEVVVEHADSEVLHINAMEFVLVNEIVGNAEPATKAKNPQCVAYIPAKARECVRFAVGGNIYCCVHSPTRYKGWWKLLFELDHIHKTYL